jgi:hypothetical protein
MCLPCVQVLVITVQVMAEASDACVRELLRNCPTPRALPVIADAITKDKSPKLRQCCVAYLLQVGPSMMGHKHMSLLLAT